jgi:hypothetical protein
VAEAAITGARVSGVQCPACRQMVPVISGDVGTMTLDGICDAAISAACGACRHPEPHTEVRVGTFGA